MQKAPKLSSSEALQEGNTANISSQRHINNILFCQKLYCIDTLQELQKAHERRLVIEGELLKLNGHIRSLESLL